MVRRFIRIRDIERIKRNLETAAREMRKAQVRTTSDAADVMLINAMRLAPIKTGETLQGIVKRRSRQGYIVESTVPGPFFQNLWTNQKAQTNYPRAPSMVWNFRNPTLYGDGTHKATGTPRWFDRAAQIVQKRRRSFAVRNTNKALKTAFRYGGK